MTKPLVDSALEQLEGWGQYLCNQAGTDQVVWSLGFCLGNAAYLLHVILDQADPRIGLAALGEALWQQAQALEAERAKLRALDRSKP